MKYYKSYNDFICYLLSIIGTTIIGIKPAEIITLSIINEEERTHWQECKKRLIFLSEIYFVETKVTNNRQQVFFYNAEALKNTLSNEEIINFLQLLGYPSLYDFNDYLNCLIDRLRSEEFPHEIGVFLGYPLKDVKGYMGFDNEKLVTIKGWHYYGDPTISYQRYLDVKNAQVQFDSLLNKLTDFNI